MPKPSPSLLGISSHAPLHPSPGFVSLLLHLNWILQQVLNGVLIRNVPSLLDSGPRCHSILPSLQMWELINVNASPACACYPTPVGDVCDGALVANEVSRGGLLEVGVEDSVEATRLVGVALYAVFDVLGCIP